MESPHTVLGVEPDAGAAEIEAAYRERVKETHPDQDGSVRAFLVVRSAYEELRKPGGDAPETGATAGSPAAGTNGSAATPPDEPETAGTTVEYLNYDVLADFGWRLDDEDLFAQAAESDLVEPDFGRFHVQSGGGSLLEAAEDVGYAWPFACRGGACANCAVAVCEGDLSTPVNHILPDEMLDRGIRLSCVGAPESGDLQVVYNVKHLPELDDLRLPPRPFEAANAGD